MRFQSEIPSAWRGRCLMADLHGTTLSHPTSLRQAYDLGPFTRALHFHHATFKNSRAIALPRNILYVDN